MEVKNIYGDDIEILGVKLRKDASRPLSDFGDVSKIRDGIDTFLQAIDGEAIQLLYSDGKVVTKKADIVDILSGNDDKPEKDEFAGQYYYLRDVFRVKKDEPVLKKFIGRVYRIAVTPRGTIDMSSKCESGLELPKAGLPTCETFELKPPKGSDINEVYLATDKREGVWVTVVMDGYSTEPLDVLQPFINDWKE
jgi:hypothetical protein